MSLFPTKILLATDGTANSNPAARAAAELSDKTGSTIHVIHIGQKVSRNANINETKSGEDSPAQKARNVIDQQIKDLEAAGGSVAESHIVPGKDPAKEIIKLTKDEDIGMVVIGSRGLGRLQYAVQGSVSSSVVRDAFCPVLVVRADEEDG